MSNPTFVAAYAKGVNAGDPAASITVANVQNGDWILTAAFESYGTNTLTPGGTLPGTFTQIGSQVGSPNAPNYQNCVAAFFRKTATAAGTYTVTQAFANEAVLIVLHLRNVNAIDGTPQVNAVAQNSSSQTVTMAATSPTTADAMLVSFYGLITYAGTFTWTPPSGMIERADANASNSVVTVGAATQLLTASGSTGTRAATSSVGTAATYGQAYAQFALSGAANSIVKTGGIGPASAAGGAKALVHERPKTGMAAVGTAVPSGAKTRQATNPKTATGVATAAPSGTRQVVTLTKRGTAAARSGTNGAKIRFTLIKTGTAAARSAAGGGEVLAPSQLTYPVMAGVAVQSVDAARLYPLAAPPAVGIVVNPLADVAHVVALGAPYAVGVATQRSYAASTALAPIGITVQVQPVTVGFIGSSQVAARGVPVTIVRARTRVMAQTIIDSQWIHRELPVAALKVIHRLSTSQAITGVIDPEDRVLGEVLAALPPWGTWLHVEQGGDIIGSGILTPPSVEEDGTMNLTAVGVSAYAARIPYVGEYAGIHVDPIAVMRTLWDHIQSFPRGNLGVTVLGASGVLIGNPPAAPTTSTDASGKVVVDPFPEGPYYIHGYEFPAVGRVIDQLGQDTPFEWVEEQGWTDPTTKDAVYHRIRAAAPVVGVRRYVNLTQGENILEHGAFEEPDGAYCDSAYVKGSGEGRDSITGYASTNVPDRLRMPTVVTDKTIQARTNANTRAAAEVAYRLSAIEELGQVAVNVRHPNSPYGSFEVGDEVLPRVRLPYYGAFAQWHRVTEIEYDPEVGIAACTLTRQSSFRG